MKIIIDTLEPIIETWDDPGDYPSNAGQCSLPSYKYIAGCDGAIVVELEPSDLIEFANEQIEVDTNPSLHSIKWAEPQVAIVDGRVRLTYTIDECESEDDLEADND